jgi:uncharacterized membrane protein YphA (DoxX/SURF4 family)
MNAIDPRNHPGATGSRLDNLAARCATPAVRWIALLGLCAAYLQGGLDKAMDFPGAVAEMTRTGLAPPGFWAAAVIVLELGASGLILTGIRRWIGALLLAAFTLAASLMANRFWAAAPADRFNLENAFFEHLGLVGGFLLVAWHDLAARAKAQP